MRNHPSQMDDEQIEAMIEALDSRDWSVRNDAVDSLMAMGIKAQAALLREVHNGTMRRAVGAARVLSRQQEPRIFDLMKQLVMSQNPLLGQIAVEYLTRYGEGDVADVLLACLPNCHYMVQISVVQALGILRAEQAVDTLVDLLDMSNGSTLRMTIVSVLGSIGDLRALPVVRRLIEDEDAHVRSRASRAAEQLENPSHEEH